jgi:uncharacterized protein HemX
MHSAFIDNQAETKAVRFTRAVLRSALACALVFGAGTAMAQQHGDRRDDFMQQQQQQQGGRGRFWLPQQDRDQREAEQRAYEEQQRRAQQQQYQQDQREAARRGSGRLTPDERRDLRRQINEAGMDLYQQRGR